MGQMTLICAVFLLSMSRRCSPRPALVPRSQRWHARTDLLVLGSHYRILVHTDKTGATSPGFLPALTGSTADGYKAP